jgi:flavodoxin
MPVTGESVPKIIIFFESKQGNTEFVVEETAEGMKEIKGTEVVANEFSQP